MKFIKKYNLEIIFFVIFTLTRIPNLGHDMFNTDVFKWKSRTYDFGTGVFTLDFEKTIQKYHPGVTLMWIGTAGIKMFNLYHDVVIGTPPADNLVQTIFALHTLQKTLVVLVTALFISFTIYPLRKLFGDKYTIIFSILLLSEPFYIALNKVMHLEGLMTTFMISSFIWFYFYLKEGKYKRLIFSSFLAACAFLTKTSSLFLIPFFGLILLLEKLLNRNENVSFKKELLDYVKKYLIWFVVTLLFFVLIWPAMYTHPLLALKTIYRGIFTIGIERDHIQLFLGDWVSDPGPYYYLVVFLYRASLWFLIGLLGFFYSFKNIKLEENKKDFIIYTLLFAIFYTLELTIPSKKLDRYILPTMIVLLFVAATFYEYLYFEVLEKIKNAKYIFITMATLSIVGTLLYLHPYYFSYYSPLMGGLRKGIFDLEPKWIFGQHEIVNYFENVLKKGELGTYEDHESLDSKINKNEINDLLTIGFQEKYYTQIWPFIHEIGARATIENIVIHAQNSNYFVYPIYDDDAYLEDRVNIEYAGSIYVRGVKIYNVYEKVN